MKLIIIIPIFNEEKTISKIIKKVMLANTKNYKKEIIAVDDASQDKTYEILKQLKNKYKFTVLRHEKNKGKSVAIKTALKNIKPNTEDAIIIQDADLEYDPDDWKKMLNKFDAGNPVVYGSRNLSPNTQRGYLTYFLGARALTELCNILFRSKLTDLYTCYKLIRADIIIKAGIESKQFDFCPEITAKILSNGYSIKEIAINYYPRSFSEGKKIKFWHGISGAWILFKYKFFKFK